MTRSSLHAHPAVRLPAALVVVTALASTASALTYVAGALAALTQLLYFILLFLGNRQ